MPKHSIQETRKGTKKKKKKKKRKEKINKHKGRK
jgi:hypothetical protein